MRTLRRHPLVGVDLDEAYGWLEREQPGLGAQLRADFIATYRRLRTGLQHYAARFAGVRRVNLQRFAYSIFYVLTATEIRVLAVLHAARQHPRILAHRRRSF